MPRVHPNLDDWHELGSQKNDGVRNMTFNNDFKVMCFSRLSPT